MVVALVGIGIVGATLAYFTDTEDAKNTFTVGNVDITLTEPNWDTEGSEDAPEVYPGEPLKKDPTVKNVGANPCFVRIKVEGFDVLGDNNLITYRTGYIDDALGADWELYDGYYYYSKPLAVNAATPALFDQIVIPTTLTNGDAETKYDIGIFAEAVQAQGAKPSWSAVQDMTVEEIAAWFVTCGL